MTSSPDLNDVLKILPTAADAPFNASGKEDDPVCLPGTRIDILKHIEAWIDGEDKRHIFWLSGWAGTGKSTIARTVAREYYNRKCLVASYFFSRGGGDTSRAAKFVGTIAMQIAHKSPEFKNLLQDAVSLDEGIVQRVLGDQWRELVIAPLSQLGADSVRSPIVIVVDALDECEKESDIRQVLQLLADTRYLNRHCLRIFITSRPEVPIRDGFLQFPHAERQDFILHDISRFIVDHDISLFLSHRLAKIRPEEHVIEQLAQKAAGLFIWAATACWFICEGRKFASKRLAEILKGSSVAVTAPEAHLDEIYTTVLKHSISLSYTTEEKEEFCLILRRVLGSLTVLSSPLSVTSLSRLIHLAEEDVDQTLENLHAILDIPKEHTHPLRLHHPSFRDFLLNQKRCADSLFWVNGKQAHEALAESCIRLMSTSLKQDICGLNCSGAEVDNSRVEKCLAPEVQYACLYWVEHLQKAGVRLQDNDQINRFLQTHFLHWLEALSWMRRMSEGILAIGTLESIALVSLLLARQEHTTNPSSRLVTVPSCTNLFTI